MTRAQLRFLRVSAGEFVPDTIQQLHVTLVRILLERCDKRPAHGAGCLAANIGILARLGVFAAAPHDDVCGGGLCLFCALVACVARGGLFDEAQGRAGDAADVAAGVGGHDGEETRASLLGEVGLFEHALGGVDVREVEGGAGVARVEDGS